MPSRSEVNPWTLAQDHLQQVLDEYSYKNWFSQTLFQSYEEGRLTISVPSEFFAEWLRDHYLDAITESVQEVLPGFQEIVFSAGQDAPPPAAIDVATLTLNQPVSKKKMKAIRSFNGFNPRYTFDRFVIGSGNRFAHAAAKAVAESPGRAYNPLFLYGGTGLGKTHLMQAIGQELLSEIPGANVCYISSEQFTNQLIQSIMDKSTQKFRAKYRKVDILMIDDIHFIGGKESTQEEFFHTFNVLFDMHKQIVLSSDRCPKELQGIEARLVSRFEWGLVVDIQPPDLETRMAILQNKAREENLVVPPEVLRFIATYITTNIRELEGALVTVLAYSRLNEQKISLAMVEEVLRDLIGNEKIKPITLEQVQRAVAEHFDVRIADLRGPSRQRQIVVPRQMAMYLCKELIPSLSLSDVGEAFGGKDHTTVLYSCEKISEDARGNGEVRRTLDQLKKKLQV
ncbi:MAG TPA: chromosomal replication initiator protein DnaA [Candidatus Hydrogenedentes bacterium]|nr:chromosomal replication initiator protein DnaA [Candidatus Hydrogenedentota bacterium]